MTFSLDWKAGVTNFFGVDATIRSLKAGQKQAPTSSDYNDPEDITGRIVDESEMERQMPESSAITRVTVATFRTSYTGGKIGSLIVCAGKTWRIVGTAPSGSGGIKAYTVEQAKPIVVNPRTDRV